jgi:subtilisin
MKHVVRAVVGGLCVAAALAGSAPSSTAATATSPYIVVFKDTVSNPAAVAAQQAKANGFQIAFVYKHALKGYAASFSDATVALIRSSPIVQYVSEDRIVQADQVDQPPQVVANAVLRIDGDESRTRSGDGKGAVNINVAVLDDGMDASHPDLNVVGATTCLKNNRNEKPAPPPGEPSGWHGTMVGGFIGAIDNEIGRVGVAPGARLWAVRVIDNEGFGFNSEVICGLDWVTATRADSDPANDIAVANLSLGGPGKDTGSCPASNGDASHAAFCTAVAAGVTIVAAAGNDETDFQDFSPATYDDVLAVTAMTDLDGQPGGLQPPTGQCSSQLNQFGPVVDDSPAFFSNFATLPKDQAHSVAAPGVCVGSTFPGGLYAVDSGTSFAAPLVTGTVALCIAFGRCAGLAPQQIINKIVGDVTAYNTQKKNFGYGFQGDPLRPISGRYYGYLIRAALY